MSALSTTFLTASIFKEKERRLLLILLISAKTIIDKLSIAENFNNILTSIGKNYKMKYIHLEEVTSIILTVLTQTSPHH